MSAEYLKRDEPWMRGSPVTLDLMSQIYPERDNGPMDGVRIFFDNGVILSLVWGWGTYSGPDTVELAVFTEGRDENGWLTGEIAEAVFGAYSGDDVDGYCNAERVHGYYVACQEWE